MKEKFIHIERFVSTEDIASELYGDGKGVEYVQRTLDILREYLTDNPSDFCSIKDAFEEFNSEREQNG